MRTLNSIIKGYNIIHIISQHHNTIMTQVKVPFAKFFRKL